MTRLCWFYSFTRFKAHQDKVDFSDAVPEESGRVLFASSANIQIYTLAIEVVTVNNLKQKLVH